MDRSLVPELQRLVNAQDRMIQQQEALIRLLQRHLKAQKKIVKKYRQNSPVYQHFLGIVEEN